MKTNRNLEETHLQLWFLKVLGSKMVQLLIRLFVLLLVLPGFSPSSDKYNFIKKSGRYMKGTFVF